MYPVLFSIGSWALSSFGLFLSLSFILSSFFFWRLCQTYEVEEEQTIDLLILTFLGVILGARLHYILLHLDVFDSFLKIVLITRFPGLSFWGGLLGGVVTLLIFARKFKLNFWEIADFVTAAIFLGLALGNLGCILGGCQPGLVSDLPIAVKVAGLIGKRFPLSIIEGFLYLLTFFYLWKRVLKFHFPGQIFSLGLLLLGVIKLLTETYRADRFVINLFGLSIPEITLGQIYSLLLIILGVRFFYLQGKRSLLADLSLIAKFFINKKVRGMLIFKLKRQWYNLAINLKLGVRRWRRDVFRKLKIRPTPPTVHDN